MSVAQQLTVITEPTTLVLVDKQDITADVLTGSTNHKANAIDSFSLDLKNEHNKYGDFFLEEMKDIEIWLGHPNDLEKVFHGFVETPTPTRTKDADIYRVSGLSTGACLDWQEVPDGTSEYSAKTAAYIMSDVFASYVELLLEGKILSSATTYTYDPSNKTVLSICKDMATFDECFFHVTPYDRLIFDQTSEMSTISTVIDELLINSIKKIPDFSNIINYFAFHGSGVSVTSEDAESQSKYYKRAKSEEDLNITDSDVAQAYADQVVEAYKDPQWRYEVDIKPILGLSVNQKIFLKTSDIDKLIKIESIQRRFSKGSYSISLTLQDSPVPLTGLTFVEGGKNEKRSFYSSLGHDIRKLKKDVAGGVGWKKIVDETLSAAATDITITGLDLATDKAYLILFTTKNVLGSGNGIYLYCNNDTTVANYTNQWLRADNNEIAAQRENQPYLVYVHAGEEVYCQITMMRTPDGYPVAYMCNLDYVTGGMRIFNRVYFWNNTTNVTRLDFHALAANLMGTGTKLLIFKVKS